MIPHLLNARLPRTRLRMSVRSQRAHFMNILAVASLFASAFAYAGPCDPGLTRDSMTPAERAEVARSGVVRRDVAYGDYYVSYLFAEAKFDAALTMGIYASCGEHAGKDGLGDFIQKSEMKSPATSNPFQVYYVQSGNLGFSGGEYQVENSVRNDNGTFLMTTRLVGSSGAHFSPKSLDAYVRMTPLGPNGVSVIACNYMQPKSPPPFSTGTYNKMAKERLLQTGKSLMKWVLRASQDSGRAQAYREHLKALLGR